MKRALLISILIAIGLSASAQMDSIRNETHIFWSKAYAIQMLDFRDTTRSESKLKQCNETNLCWGAFTGLYSIMDIPKKKKERNRKDELIYFAPAFDVINSYRLTTDTLDFLKQTLVFDLFEVAARKCRIELDSFYKLNPSVGIKGVLFKSVESNIKENLNGLINTYTHDVYINNIEGAYEEWRILVDKWLEETKGFQTTAIDRMRFIKNKPIAKGYKKAPSLIGNLHDKK